MRKKEKMASKNGLGRPPKINRTQIVECALKIGLMDLTLTAVAEGLGVTLQALYHHVRDRDELLDLVAQQLTESVPLPPDHGQEWSDWAYGFAYALKKLYETAPGLADKAVEKTQTTPGVLIRFETSIRIAMRSGYDDVTSLWITRAITEFVSSWVAREQRRAAIGERNGVSYAEGLLTAARRQNEVDVETLCRILEKTSSQSSDVRFDFNLRCILSGIATQRPAVSTTFARPKATKK